MRETESERDRVREWSERDRVRETEKSERVMSEREGEGQGRDGKKRKRWGRVREGEKVRKGRE